VSAQRCELSLRSAPSALTPRALTGGAGRWLRGSAVGLCATALATAGHALERGPAPAVPVTAGLAVVAVLASVALSRVRWRLGSLFVVLAAAQLVFHVALAGGALDTGARWSMLVGHSAAALVTAFVLHRGEDACWQVAYLMARPARALRAVVVGPLGFPPVACWFVYVGSSRIQLSLVYAAPRRGPPSRHHSLITR
jgi:hypothetical protein